MPLRKIEIYGSSILRRRAEEVHEITPEILTLIEDMQVTMVKRNGIGLAAPQVGVSKRIMIVTYGVEESDPKPVPMINPEIVSQSESSEVCDEGCLSVPDITGSVERWTAIHIKAETMDGEVREEELTGLNARIFQHELDHLNGILFVDRLSPIKRDLVKRKLKKRLKKQNSKTLTRSR